MQQRPRASTLAPKRVPRWHEQVQNHPKHVPRHARTARPTFPNEEGEHVAKFAAFFQFLLVLTARHRRQFHLRQGLPSRHPSLQAGRPHGVVSDGDCGGHRKAGLDEHESFRGMLLLARESFEEGESGVSGITLSKVDQGRLTARIDKGGIGASFKEEADKGGTHSLARLEAGIMKRCSALMVPHIDSGSDRRVLQQALKKLDAPHAPRVDLIHESSHTIGIGQEGVRATVQQSKESVEGSSRMKGGASPSRGRSRRRLSRPAATRSVTHFLLKKQLHTKA